MTKRVKVIILSVVLGITLLFGWGLRTESPSLAAVFVASIMYFGLYWVLEFEVVGFRLVYIFVLPVLFDFMFVQRILSSEIRILGGVEGGELIIAVLFGVLNYILILTANILNVASVRKIPLLQVAQTSSYFFTIFLSFLTFDMIQDLNLSPIMDILIVVVVFYLIIHQLLWFVIEDRNMLLHSTIAVDFLLVLIYLVMSFWPIPYFLLNIFLSGIMYVFCGYIMHSAKRSLTGGTELEYGFIMIVLLFLVMAASDWGSFGGLF